MFDDLKPQVPSSSSQPSQSSGGQADPYGAPRSVEDIFALTNRAENKLPSSVESLGKSMEKPAVFQAVEPSSRQETHEANKGIGSSDKLKKYTALASIVLVFIIIASGGIYLYGRYFNQSGNKPELTDDSKEKDAPSNIEEEVNKAENVPANNTAPQAPTSNQQIIDSDGDGLTDEEEMIFGTNINSIDSDDDKLYDRDEVKVYQTDPLNKDSDGDGFLDGVEVEGGYNPRGAGRLYSL